VVLNAFAAPPAATAIANVAASVFSGSSTTPTVSYSPKASPACSNFPLSFSTARWTALSRFCGCVTMAAHASGGVCQLNEIGGHAALPSAGLDPPGCRSSRYTDGDVTGCRAAPMRAAAPGSSHFRCGQTGEGDIVDVRAGKAVGAGVVLEGGDDPLLGLDRREPGQACALHELEHRVTR
jgi:hypothetical protein